MDDLLETAIHNVASRIKAEIQKIPAEWFLLGALLQIIKTKLNHGKHFFPQALFASCLPKTLLSGQVFTSSKITDPNVSAFRAQENRVSPAGTPAAILRLWGSLLQDSLKQAHMSAFVFQRRSMCSVHRRNIYYLCTLAHFHRFRSRRQKQKSE